MSTLQKKPVASGIDLIGTLIGSETPSQEPLAATAYGEDPVAAAAADGWAVDYVEDSATSKKHPARFAVLTKTIDRAARTAAGSFGSYPSVAAMGSDEGAIVIGFDTEFVGTDEFDEQRGWVGESADVVRRIVSYQFVVIDPTDDTLLRAAAVLPQRYEGPRGVRVARLSFEKALEIAVTALRLHEHPLAVGWSEKGVLRQDVVDETGRLQQGRWFSSRSGAPQALPINLVAHWQHADLTTFVDRRKAHNTWNAAYPERAKKVSSRAGWSSYRARWLDSTTPDILRAVISASAGMVSPAPVRMVLAGENKRWARPLAISIRDSMAQSGAEPLKKLGMAVGVAKLDVPGDWITRMDEYLEAHPVEFLDYALNGSVIALEYVSQVYGDHRAVPLTLPTAAARTVREIVAEEIVTRVAGMSVVELRGRHDFNAVFGGLVKVTKNCEATSGVENQLDFYKKRELQPVDGAAATWIHASAMAFRGGYNMSAELGLFEQTTHDLDLLSCYPTSSSTI